MKRESRNIKARWIITGVLELVTPTHLSNGDPDPSVDLPLITDPLEGRALLPGASLAGALRHYLNEYIGGYVEKPSGLEENSDESAGILFGGRRSDDEGKQSPLIVYDALGREKAPRIELRDGVRIDSKTHAAAVEINEETGAVAGAKFDVQLLAAGNKFDIGFELLLNEKMVNDKTQIKENLAIALAGLQHGHITLGGRKRRGYGQCRVTKWQLWQYDLTKKEGLRGWLSHNRTWAEMQPRSGKDIVALLGLDADNLPQDCRDRLTVTATFSIDGSVLIRSGFEIDAAPDTSHLASYRPSAQKETPVLSGTSLAGLMRSQAYRIAHTVCGNETRAKDLIHHLFGYMPKPSEVSTHAKQVSRVRVQETPITSGFRSLVQSRVSIDRFTGGALESALFAEQPLFGGTAVIHFSIDHPEPAEIGLLLLVLKDLWTGFVPIGGETSVGRGRLRGKTAVLHHTASNKSWTLSANGDELEITGDEESDLEQYVNEFVAHMEGNR